MEELKSVLTVLISIGLVVFIYYGVYVQKRFNHANDINIQVKKLTLENLKLDNEYKEKIIEDLDNQLKNIEKVTK